MMRKTWSLAHAVVVTSMLVLAATAWAQQTSSIAGRRRDTSGAVLSRGTVRVASPGLIRRVSTAAADAQGRFNLVNLRPGTYVGTVLLAGFNSVKPQGIQVTAGFTATV